MSSISERLQAVEGRIAKALASRKSEIEQPGNDGLGRGVAAGQ